MKRRPIKRYVVAASLLVIGLLGTGATGSANEPVKVLQSVEVSLTSDGTIREMTVVELAQARGEDSAKKNTRGLDPSAAADRLPAVLRPSYVANGRAGTDLADLIGHKGRVDITFAVTNTTGSTETITAKDPMSGQVITKQAVVTTPVTVILTAVFPEGADASIIQHVAATDEGTDGSVTVRDGKTIVQWGAVLAPPALPGSTAFRLVADVGDFELESLTMSAELGVANDFSLNRIVDQVFGTTGQVTEVQSRMLTRGLNNDLIGVEQKLDGIQKVVRDAALTSGKRQIELLQAATTDLDLQINLLKGMLETSKSSFTGKADASLSAADQAIADAVAKAGTNLDETMRHIEGIQARLNSSDPASLATKLDQLIGPDTGCKTDSKGIRCVVSRLRDQLIARQQADLRATKDALASPRSLADTAIVDVEDELTRQVDAIDRSVSKLQQIADNTNPPGTTGHHAGHLDAGITTVNDIASGIDEVNTVLGTTAGDLQQHIADLDAAIAGLRDDDLYRKLFDGTDPTSIRGQILASQGRIAEALAAVIEVKQGACDLRADVADKAAAGDITNGADEDLDTRIEALLDKLGNDACTTDPLAPLDPNSVTELLQNIGLDDVDSTLDGVRVQLDTTIAVLETLRNDLRTVKDSISAQMTDLQTRVDELRTLTATGTGNHLTRARNRLASTTTDLEGISRDLERIYSGTDAPTKKASSAVTKLVTDTKKSLDDLQGGLETAIDTTLNTLSKAATDELAAALQQVKAVSDRLGADSRQKLDGAKADLANQAADNRRRMDDLKRQIEADMSDLVQKSSIELDNTREKLNEGTDQVLTNLTGSNKPDLSTGALANLGFQGTLNDQLNEIGAQGGQVKATRARATTFGGVRRTNLLSLLVMDQQRQKGLERLGNQTTFDGSPAADDATVNNVFVFTIGEVR